MHSPIFKKEKPNLFTEISFTDKLADLDFIFEPEIGKAVSTPSKIGRYGLDIHLAFDFVFDEEKYGLKLYFCLSLSESFDPRIK